MRVNLGRLKGGIETRRCRPPTVERVGRWVFRHRGVLALPLVLGIIAVVLTCRPTVTGAARVVTDLAGLLLAGAGHFLRVWALGHVGPTTRSVRLQAPFLAQSGPYARFRNPLYLGNLLIGAGVALSTRRAALWVLIPLWLWLQYRLIILVEERFLQERFGEGYRLYRAVMPRFLPRWRAHSGRPRRFAVSLCPSKEWQAVSAAGALLLLARWLALQSP